jgi:LysM repeat protein
MLKARYPVILFSVISILYSCRSSRPDIRPTAFEPNAAAYIEKYRDIAISEMRRTGVPASITLAQGMIESDFGRSRLAREANNHFGIKCHSNWKGQSVTHHDDRKDECFRKYNRAEDSFYDHSDFLRTGSRYRSLFDLSVKDYKGWARGLKSAGYATNPDYANMLIRKIEEHNLAYYDSGASGKAPLTARVNQVPASNPSVYRNEEIISEIPSVNNTISVPSRVERVRENNRIKYIIVRDNESREMIEKEFHLLGWELPRYNELENSFTPIAGQVLYLQPKRDRAEPGKEIHVVAEGETIYSISLIYGVKVKKLQEYNRTENEPVAGDRIWLRSTKPVR